MSASVSRNEDPVSQQPSHQVRASSPTSEVAKEALMSARHPRAGASEEGGAERCGEFAEFLFKRPSCRRARPMRATDLRRRHKNKKTKHRYHRPPADAPRRRDDDQPPLHARPGGSARRRFQGAPRHGAGAAKTLVDPPAFAGLGGRMD